MGASDLTTELTEAGNGEVVDGDRGSAAAAAHGNVAKKRRKQKALAVVAANGHGPKAPGRRKGAGATATHGAAADAIPAAEPGHANGSVVIDDPTVELPVIEEPGADVASPPGELAVIEELGADVASPPGELAVIEEPGADVASPPGELSVIEELDDDLEPAFDEHTAGEELDGDDLEAASDEPQAGGGRRARKRAAKRAKAAAAPAQRPRGRAARRAQAARRATPAARRAELVATAASITAAAVAAADAPPRKTRRGGTTARRLFALVAILMIPGAVYALAVTEGPVTSLSRADASYMSAQLMTADQRVRRQLVRLRPRHTSPAVAATRDATLTARSLALELDDIGGADAQALQRALRLESAWLNAVGSVLSNPRSPLRGELVARDAALRPALRALPGPAGHRKGGAQQLERYATSRASAAKHKR